MSLPTFYWLFKEWLGEPTLGTHLNRVRSSVDDLRHSLRPEYAIIRRDDGLRWVSLVKNGPVPDSIASEFTVYSPAQASPSWTLLALFAFVALVFLVAAVFLSVRYFIKSSDRAALAAKSEENAALARELSTFRDMFDQVRSSIDNLKMPQASEAASKADDEAKNAISHQLGEVHNSISQVQSQYEQMQKDQKTAREDVARLESLVGRSFEDGNESRAGSEAALGRLETLVKDGKSATEAVDKAVADFKSDTTRRMDGMTADISQMSASVLNVVQDRKDDATSLASLTAQVGQLAQEANSAAERTDLALDKSVADARDTFRRQSEELAKMLAEKTSEIKTEVRLALSQSQSEVQQWIEGMQADLFGRLDNQVEDFNQRFVAAAAPAPVAAAPVPAASGPAPAPEEPSLPASDTEVAEPVPAAPAVTEPSSSSADAAAAAGPSSGAPPAEKGEDRAPPSPSVDEGEAATTTTTTTTSPAATPAAASSVAETEDKPMGPAVLESRWATVAAAPPSAATTAAAAANTGMGGSRHASAPTNAPTGPRGGRGGGRGGARGAQVQASRTNRRPTQADKAAAAEKAKWVGTGGPDKESIQWQLDQIAASPTPLGIFCQACKMRAYDNSPAGQLAAGCPKKQCGHQLYYTARAEYAWGSSGKIHK